LGEGAGEGGGVVSCQGPPDAAHLPLVSGLSCFTGGCGTYGEECAEAADHD